MGLQTCDFIKGGFQSYPCHLPTKGVQFSLTGAVSQDICPLNTATVPGGSPNQPSRDVPWGILPEEKLRPHSYCQLLTWSKWSD